jgi:Domain of unknown function (DUF4180)
MTDLVKDIHGIRVLVCDAHGPKLATERDGDDILGAAFGEGARMVAIPVARLSDDFFRLSTKLAGTVVQKFANYQVRLAIVGDVSAWTTSSKSFHDFVYEANRGTQLTFAEDPADLEARLIAR